MKKILFLFLITIFLGLFSFANKTLAQDKDSVIFTPQISIPGSEFQKGAEVEIEDSTRTIGIYIKSIYNYLLAIVGLLAVIVLMASGIIWMTAAGNTERISQAKGWMTGSLTGLVLMLLSYVLLKTINPNLVNFRTEGIQSLAKIEKGCCKLDNYKDTAGMFTGSKNTSMTMTTGALSCYYAAIELNEPGVKKIEELTKEEKNDIQAYMEKIGKFKANYISLGFTKCEQTGACVRFREGGFTDTNYIFCVNSLIRDCNEHEVPEEFQEKVPDIFNYTRKFLPGMDCKDISPSFFIDTFNLPAESEIDLSKINCNQEGQRCKDDEGKRTEYFCYDNVCWPFNSNAEEAGKGLLGEPCGNDGGICVSNGPDCDEYPGLKGREWGGGGRRCGEDVKCCY